MKTLVARSKFFGIILLVILPCIGILFLGNTPIHSAIRSIVEVQRCEAQMEEKLSIEWTYLEISDYAVSLLHPGMTRTEVKEALEIIAPVQIIRHDATSDDILITPCSNRFKNVLLYVSYSPEGNFERVVNAFDD